MGFSNTSENACPGITKAQIVYCNNFYVFFKITLFNEQL